MRMLLRYSLLSVGVILGVYHLLLAAKGLFVARNEEPPWFWIFLFSGPLTTLPGSLTAFFEPRIGAIWLICGGVLPFIAAIAVPTNQDFRSALWFFSVYSGPLVLLGLVAVILSKGKA